MQHEIVAIPCFICNWLYIYYIKKYKIIYNKHLLYINILNIVYIINYIWYIEELNFSSFPRVLIVVYKEAKVKNQLKYYWGQVITPERLNQVSIIFAKYHLIEAHFCCLITSLSQLPFLHSLKTITYFSYN